MASGPVVLPINSAFDAEAPAVAKMESNENVVARMPESTEELAHQTRRGSALSADAERHDRQKMGLRPKPEIAAHRTNPQERRRY